MHTQVYQFTFAPEVDVAEAERTLQLAAMAAEGLFGQARVRMELTYSVDLAGRTICVDAQTAPGEAVVRILAGFYAREFGSAAFTIHRQDADVVAEPSVGAAA